MGLLPQSRPALAALVCANTAELARLPHRGGAAAIDGGGASPAMPVEAYNRFVLAYRPELQKSDADLKAYFIRRGGEHGEADYDTFKTKLANLSSLSDIADGPAYCANARVSFEMAMRDGQSLANYVAGQQLVVSLPEQRLCVADRQVLASANTSPAAGVRDEEVYVPRHATPPQFGSAPVRVAGVPAYSLPASPYQGRNDVVAMAPPLPAEPAPAAYVQQPYGYYGDGDAPPPPPPPPPRSAYGAPAWPPGWAQYPYQRRWYGYGY